MKFPRQLRVLKGPGDYSAYACVFFLLVMFIMIGPVTYTSGLRLQLPLSNELPGTDQPSVFLAVDAEGRLYFENALITEAELARRLALAARSAGEPLTLVIQADKSVTNDQLIRLGMIARQAGIHEGLLATLPRLIESPDTAAKR